MDAGLAQHGRTGWPPGGPGEAAELGAALALLEARAAPDRRRVLSRVLARAAARSPRPAGAERLRPLRGALLRIAAHLLTAPGAVPGALPRPMRARPAAGRLLGIELEGLSPEDQVLEVARRLVRLAASAAARAGRPPPDAPPAQAARAALRAAARRWAPGLLVRRRPAAPARLAPTFTDS